MSAHLRHYLAESYLGDREFLTKKLTKDIQIQIDDQDDNDDITEFCNIFITVKENGIYVLELIGRIPMTRDISDLAEIYGGYAEPASGHIALTLTVNQIEAVLDLAKKIRKTAKMGALINNPGWHRISARTISSLYRFVRIIKEYARIHRKGF
jgi:hypothetical protein